MIQRARRRPRIHRDTPRSEHPLHLLFAGTYDSSGAAILQAGRGTTTRVVLLDEKTTFTTLATTIQSAYCPRSTSCFLKENGILKAWKEKSVFEIDIVSRKLLGLTLENIEKELEWGHARMSASSVLWVWYSVVQFSQIPMHASDTGIWDVRIPGRSSILRWDVHHGMHSRTLAPDMSSISATGQGLRVDPSTVYLFRTSKDPKRSVEVLHVKSARKTWDHEGDRIHRHYCTLTNPEIRFFFSLVSSKGVIRSADHEYDICYHNWDPLRYVATGMVVRSGSTISLKLLPLGIFKVLITMMISVLLWSTVASFSVKIVTPISPP